MPSEFKLNSSIIDVTLCALDFSFIFFYFLEVHFYSGYLFLFRSINSPLSASLENQASFLWSAEHIHQQKRWVIPGDFQNQGQ